MSDHPTNTAMSQNTASSDAAKRDTHTPGPWHYRLQRFDGWGSIRGGPDNHIVAVARSGRTNDEIDLNAHRRNRTDPYEANGRLIAAAPDMLAALREIVAKWGFPNTPKWHRAHAAIAKATGAKP